MKVLFAVDEAFPLYKIGGLGDVGGSLPKALTALGVDIRIALPLHPEIAKAKEYWPIVDKLDIVYGNEKLPVTIYVGKLDKTNVPVYVFEEKKFLSVHTDASDNHADKFTVFSLAIAAWLSQNHYWQPQILHLNDWHTAMIPVILEHLFSKDEYKVITTIHNLAYQGNTSTPIVQKLGIAADKCKILSWDQQDNFINILLEGMLHSDIISAVSPSYAREILTSEYGEKINEILEARKNQIVGIVNGIDQATFNPETDSQLYTNYNQESVNDGKKKNKEELRKELSLPGGEDKLMIGFVGRVDPNQKGIQLIIEALKQNRLVNNDCQFVFLGSGDPSLEKALHEAGDKLGNVRIFTKYDEKLAARIYAASDLVIIPSKYEPCGLVQMIAMRYGSIPIARKTGGLADTIVDDVDGFLFDTFDTESLVIAIDRAIKKFSDLNSKQIMVNAAMKKDFSWNKPAKEYVQLYEDLLLESEE
jgi:starch synthase